MSDFASCTRPRPVVVLSGLRRGGILCIDHNGKHAERVINDDATDADVDAAVNAMFAELGLLVHVETTPMPQEPDEHPRCRPGPPPRQETARERNERYRRASR